MVSDTEYLKDQGQKSYMKGLLIQLWGNSWGYKKNNSVFILLMQQVRKWDMVSFENRSHVSDSGPTCFHAGVDKVSVNY